MVNGYQVTFKMAADGAIEGVEAGHCGCVKGNDVCHHMIALLLHGHYNISCTDIAQKWNRPAERADKNTGSKVSDLFKPSYAAYRAIPNPLSDEDLDFAFRCSGMCGDGAAGAIWLLSPPPDNDKDDTLISVKDFISSPQFIASDNKKMLLEIFFKMSWEDIICVAQLTVGQRKNSLWLKSRMHRITASKFGDVLAVVQKNRKPFKSLMKHFLEISSVPAAPMNNKRPPKPGSGVHALLWGQDNEGPAIEQFQSKTGLKVNRYNGLWLHSSGKIGASPDGLIGRNAIVEVKCPYKIKDGNTVNESIHIMGKWVVNEDHEYFHQIQGQLYMTKRSLCYLIIYISKDLEYIEIPLKDSWADNIPKLITFYDKYPMADRTQTTDPKIWVLFTHPKIWVRTQIFGSGPKCLGSDPNVWVLNQTWG
ncbi:Exonuclease [Frankliniella fusca]|uniref:Exonuclease n=1 Tax=Frankliniella fusca TaxID=407009 RepID=A0AAE1HP52_9NEOP|nr:Exonuclease [Frankliniella fusca]